MPSLDNDKSKPHFLIVEGRFYAHISDMLAQGAIRELDAAGATYETVTVPGALEIPVAIQLAAARKDGGRRFDGYIALGCVIRGETYHFEIVCNESAAGIARLALKHSMAVGNGILTCENEAQAIERADPAKGDKGGDAARAALAVFNIKKQYKI